MSAFGEWTTLHGLPAFSYTMDQERDPRALWDPILDPPTRRHVVHLGNRRITLVADNFGRCDLFDEHTGLRWLTRGTGVSRIGDLSTEGSTAERLFGPTFVVVRAADERVSIERTVLCPEGEQPWVLIRLRVRNLTGEPLRLALTEEWDSRPADIRLISGSAPAADPGLELESPGGERSGSGRLTVALDLENETVLEFRYGLLAEDTSGNAAGTASGDAASGAAAGAGTGFGGTGFGGAGFGGAGFGGAGFEDSLAKLAARLPRARAAQAPEAEREIPWHAALLTGGACADGVLGGHTLDQGSCYSFRHGFNGAARDPLQHALPLVYTEPDLALSVLRNTCAWGSPDGDLPYALRPDKSPWTELFRPSDQNLWALWLGAEYLAATGDARAFGEAVPYHPAHAAQAVPLGENLRRQFRFFADVVGRGGHGHVRILNADWNDLAISMSGVPRQEMIEHGESVLNSAMAAWVLPRYAALAERLGDHATGAEARELGEELRALVAGEWNGRWFRRAYGPGAVVGEDDLWLEVQPWAILCGAAPPEQARALLERIEDTAAAGSPLGARVRWPAAPGADGAIWYAINMTLVWAAAAHAPELGWAWWRRMSLAAHAAAYPDVWEGTLSGPDAYLPPESARPGRTWDLADVGVAMQAYPVANLHAHAQPLLAYLRLLGVEPGPSGELRVGGGARFQSAVLTVGAPLRGEPSPLPGETSPPRGGPSPHQGEASALRGGTSA
ncbi:GH36-type glycosyl hydrolase domain-containing protein [Nonomuraea mangrovi]|uniref:GH36-type glycosyl hydrolase domain-containing protein n=1 Tax=Nonomuraea mangrovi TaxID=2316207 RepID=A0ABW4SQX0_9ACTN